MPRREGATVAELALALVECPRCGAKPGQSCAARMLEAARRVEERRDLGLIAQHAPHLAHQERLDRADVLADSAVAYGLVERIPR
jgi:hypothetical protein